jgi:hypothetical protein
MCSSPPNLLPQNPSIPPIQKLEKNKHTNPTPQHITNLNAYKQTLKQKTRAQNQQTPPTELVYLQTPKTSKYSSAYHPITSTLPFSHARLITLWAPSSTENHHRTLKTPPFPLDHPTTTQHHYTSQIQKKSSHTHPLPFDPSQNLQTPTFSYNHQSALQIPLILSAHPKTPLGATPQIAHHQNLLILHVYTQCLQTLPGLSRQQTDRHVRPSRPIRFLSVK